MSTTPVPVGASFQPSQSIPVPSGASFQPSQNQDQPPRSWTDSASDFASSLWKQINPVAGIKGAAQLTAHPIDTLKSDASARQQIYSDAEAAFKKGNYAEGAAHLLNAAVPFLGPQLDAAGNDFLQGNYAKGAGTATGLGLAMAAPEVIKNSGVIPKVKSAIGNAITGGQGTSIGRYVSQELPDRIANAPIADTSKAATSGGAATQITNAEVLKHAADEGIQLTPAQALQTEAARTEQTFGEQALVTGEKVQRAIAKSKSVLNDSLDAFEDKIDPQRGGLSAESAGGHIQNSAEVARSVMKENVNQAYSQVAVDQADLAGDVRGPLQKLIHDQSFSRQPSAAVEQPVFQTAAAKSAINDIQQMLSDPAMQGRQSIQSLRNLRTTLLEKGNDYGANALSDSGQRIYKLAAGKVDDAIMDAAKGTPLEDTFRDAGAQNSKLQSLYNQRGSPLYRILNTDDPAQVSDGILNRSSVHEIETLKGENFDLGPIARQAVHDIRNGGFKVTAGGLGGYPDTFLRSLLGPDATKELYLKAAIAKRLAENYNPSGSGKVVMGASQLVHPVAGIAAQAARVRSMPQPATNYLSDLAGKQ